MAVYDAFVSYSHAKDKPVAAALQSVVQKLGKPWYRRRALRVFRDDTSLSATPALWPSIEQALGQSRYLILLASPEAAISPWVNKETSYWLDHKGVDTLLIAVTDGALVWDDAAGDFIWRDDIPLPPALNGRFSGEPKWVDLTAYRKGADPHDAKFTELAADFAAAIHEMPKEDLLSNEVLQQRRALTLAWSAVGALLILATVATGAGLLAYRAQQSAVRAERQAIAERDNATRNFKIARQTADSLVVDIAHGLRNVHGMSAETVRKILETAKATFEQLAASEPDDLILQRSRSVMLDEFGDTYLTLGSLEESLNAYEDGLAIRERLANKDPTNNERRDDLWQSHTRIGNVLWARGKLDEALKAYRDGLAIAEELAAPDRNDTRWQRDLSVSYECIGRVLKAQGKLEEALKVYRDSLTIRERLAAVDPGNTQWQSDLSWAHNAFGDVLRAQGKLEEALKAYRDGLAVRERLVAVDPGNTQWQRDLSISHDEVGYVLERQGKLEGALASYRASRTIRERLAASDRGNSDWQRDLSIAYDNVGDVLKAQGKLENALEVYRNSLAIRESLVASDSSNSIWQRGLAVAYDNVATILLAQGSIDEGLKYDRLALAIVERLAATDQSDRQWQVDIIEFNRNLAINGDNPAWRFAFILTALRNLQTMAKLSDEQMGWLSEAEAQLAKLTPK